MKGPKEPGAPDPDPLDQLLGSGQEKVPTSVLGRFGRVAGIMARTGASLALRHIRSGGGEMDEKLAADLVRSFGTLKGVAMKAGQLLSYTDESLPPEVRRILATLQTHSPALPFAAIAEVVHEDLGVRGAELLERMERRPIAAASIGQVHRASLAGGERVAVKVQYPNMEKALRTEFRAAGAAIQFAKILLPAGAVEEYIAEARERILAECDYRQELLWQQRFGEVFHQHPVLQVPEVYPLYSGQRVLTSAWQEGLRFDEWLDSNPPQEARNRFGQALYEFYVGTLLRHRIFNADPHPGNYLFAPAGRMVILDYGCVRKFPLDQVRALTRLRNAVRRDRPGAIRDALHDVGANDPADGAMYDRTRALLRAFFAPVLEDQVQKIPSFSQAGFSQFLSDKRAIAQLNLPGEFLFLFRIKFGLHAVLARIGAEANWSKLEEKWSHPLWLPT
jgi:predicted unusual protein kinase regulating ubiquinone biosynthesis (AarF/ABC1/UbiB family)